MLMRVTVYVDASYCIFLVSLLFMYNYKIKLERATVLESITAASLWFRGEQLINYVDM